MHKETGKALAIRFALPSEALRPFVTTYYWTEIGIDEDDPPIEDRYHPEWGNLRFIRSNICRAAHPGEEWTNVPQFSVSGPSSLATAFQVGRGTIWGIGLMPLGWAKFIGGAADDYADRYVDGAADPAFLAFHGLADKLLAAEGSFAAELKLIEEHMAGLLDREVANEAAITAINAELVDPELGTVVELAERVNMTVRSLERLSRRAFGFPPKLLMRRQRFLRSLAQFMLD
ncbi:MAG: AraC family transcriptional regulator, partial [Pseudomonadota bacterium]